MNTSRGQNMKRENATSVGFTGNGLKRPKQFPKPFWEVHGEEVARRSCLSPLTLQPEVLSGGRVSPAEARFLSGEASAGSSNKWSGAGLLYKDGIPVPQLRPRQLLDELYAIANSGMGSKGKSTALGKLFVSCPRKSLFFVNLLV
jgi:hypothetical protein